MDKTIAGLLGAVGALVVSTPGQAAPVSPSEAVLHANSYSELLRPVPNALETLRAMDQTAPEGSVQGELVQYHDHHHHRRYYRRRYRHHHHHHHDSDYR